MTAEGAWAEYQRVFALFDAAQRDKLPEAEADAYGEQMEPLWYAMSDEHRRLARELSVSLRDSWPARRRVELADEVIASIREAPTGVRRAEQWGHWAAFRNRALADLAKEGGG